MRLLLAFLLVGCSPEGGALGIVEAVDAGPDLSRVADLAAPEDAAADRSDFARVDMARAQPDMTDPHWGCIGKRCEQPGGWCADHNVGCDCLGGNTYCARQGTDCAIDSECCPKMGPAGWTPMKCLSGACR